MIGVGNHGANSVEPTWQAARDIGKDLILGIGRRIDAQEEREGGGVKRGSGVERAAEILNGDVGMSDDETVVVEKGGSTIVGELGVGEVAEAHADGVDDDLESCVLGDILVVAREGNQRRGHVLFGRNETLHEPLAW